MSAKLVLSSPVVLIGSGYTDEEVLQAAERQFPNPPPVLRLLMERFEELLPDSTPKCNCGCEDEDKEDPHGPLECPACGSTVTVLVENKE
jgi:hypothetical protein